MVKIHFEELELCRCVLGGLLQLQSGPRVSLRRVAPMFPRAGRARAMVRTRTVRATSRSSFTTTSRALSCAHIGGLLGKTGTISRKPASGQKLVATNAGRHARVP